MPNCNNLICECKHPSQYIFFIYLSSQGNATLGEINIDDAKVSKLATAITTASSL